MRGWIKNSWVFLKCSLFPPCLYYFHWVLLVGKSLQKLCVQHYLRGWNLVNGLQSMQGILLNPCPIIQVYVHFLGVLPFNEPLHHIGIGENNLWQGFNYVWPSQLYLIVHMDGINYFLQKCVKRKFCDGCARWYVSKTLSNF